jgi:hypothetical protein
LLKKRPELVKTKLKELPLEPYHSL